VAQGGFYAIGVECRSYGRAVAPTNSHNGSTGGKNPIRHGQQIPYGDRLQLLQHFFVAEWTIEDQSLINDPFATG
jgi:hypothetical protein